MASIGTSTGFALILLTMVWTRATAQSGCTSVLMGMAPCLNYITGSSSTPSSSCCTSLASVVQSQPRCLCTVLKGGGSSFGININQTRALALPGVCNVKTPPVSECNKAADGPAISPVGSPENSPTESPNEIAPDSPDSTTSPSVSGKAGYEEVPSNGATSEGSIITIPHELTIGLFLFMASYASTFSNF